MKPIISLVGRAAVGKSAVFQLITSGKKSKTIIPTRDRMYSTAVLNERAFIIIDTGGIVLKSSEEFDKLVFNQVQAAIAESDVVFFVVDANVGVTYEDLNILKILRKQSVRILLVVNYANKTNDLSEFYAMGIKDIWPLSKLDSKALSELAKIMKLFSLPDSSHEDELSGDLIKISILGRPNVGKSTLVNRLLGNDRTIISDIPGTTLSSISIPYEHKGRNFTLIDTAGIRKKMKITDPVEQKTIYQSLRAVELADITICLIDAVDGIVDQDMKLISYVIKLGKPIIVVANKIDLLTNDEQKRLNTDIMFQLKYAKFLQIHQMSALEGINIAKLMNLVHKTYDQISKKISTALLNKLLMDAIIAHPPPLQNRKRSKLKYVHMGSLNPHIIIIHGVRTKNISKDYKKYLNNYFYKNLGLFGVQFRIIFKERTE